MRFKKTRKGVEGRFEPHEAAVLAGYTGQLLELLGPAGAADEDPLAAMVGLSEAVTPEDPVLLRLFPEAYRDDDEAARDFRRYTESDLRTSKRAAAEALLASLPMDGGTVLLDRETCDLWLGCLNDLRLALGTRLEVTEDTEPEDLAEEQQQPYAVYHWLGYAQESLLSCLMRGR